MPDPALAAATQGRLEPTGDDRRIVALDVLRGFALLGILLVNVMDFAGVATRDGGVDALANQAVSALIFYGARGAFLSTFAMLFGIGFALQIARIGRADNPRGLGLYMRRMVVLLLFGLAHTLLDPAEVLVLYALCGTLLLLFRAVPAWGVVLAALFVMPLPYLHTAVVTAQAAAAPVEASVAEDPLAWDPYRSSESIRVHAEGGLRDVVGFNTRVTIARLTPSLASYIWLTVPLPLMLVGMVVGRLGVLKDVRAGRWLIHRSLWIAAAAGVTGRVVGQTLLRLAGRDGWNPWIAMGGEVAWVLGAFFLAVAYSAALVLLLQREPWRRVLLPLQLVGRTALTNYLLQTVICTALFYQFGLGLFGDVSPAAAAALAFGIFAFQLGASALWLKRFRFGPTEWLWRSVTYGSVLANKRGIASVHHRGDAL